MTPLPDEAHSRADAGTPVLEGVAVVLYAPRTTAQESRPHPRRTTARPDVALVKDDVYAVLGSTETMGFVERVGNIFVALSGTEMNHAVEIGQSLSWDQAVHMVHNRFVSGQYGE